MLPKVLVIVGPTASGKSDLAVRLAKKFSGEVISADSRQVYKGLDIGTGKVTKKEMAGIPHHLLDVASPKKVFTAEQFSESADAAIKKIIQRGNLPIICGGTGFYIDALLGKVVLPNVPPNVQLRKRLAKKSAEELFALLKKIDPVRAKNIDAKNPRRLVRALEIAKALGTTPRPSQVMKYDALWIGLEWPRLELDARIQKRLRARMRIGMLAEAQRLRKKGLSYKRMEELGLEYRAMAQHLQGKITKEQMLEALFRDIRHFSKRQMTYWRRNSDIQWLTAKEKSGAALLVKAFLTRPAQG